MRFEESNAHNFKDLKHQLYLVTEHVPGESLLTRVKTTGPLNISEALAMMGVICDAVAHYQSFKIVHRDIKPEHIVFRDGDPHCPVILDFGLAFDATTDLEEEDGFDSPTRYAVGNTFLYLPEQLSGSPHDDKRDSRSDLAQIAGILWFAITGDRPSLAVVKTNPASTYDFSQIEGIQEWQIPRLRQFFLTAFENNIEDRWQSAEIIGKELGALPNETPIETDEEFAQELERVRHRLNRANPQQEAITRFKAFAKEVSRYIQQSVILPVNKSLREYVSLGLAKSTIGDDEFLFQLSITHSQGRGPGNLIVIAKRDMRRINLIVRAGNKDRTAVSA